MDIDQSFASQGGSFEQRGQEALLRLNTAVGKKVEEVISRRHTIEHFSPGDFLPLLLTYAEELFELQRSEYDNISRQLARSDDPNQIWATRSELGKIDYLYDTALPEICEHIYG